MSEARERFYSRMSLSNAITHKDAEIFMNYVIELKQELKESRSNHARLAVDMLNMENKKDELEQQNRKLMEALSDAICRFKQYEMDQDCDTPYNHRQAMERYEKLLTHHASEEGK